MESDISDLFPKPLQVHFDKPLITQEADGLVYAYILIWVAKSCGRSATGFEGVFLGFYI